MYEKMNSETNMRDRRLSKRILKEVMENPLFELDFFHALKHIKKPTFESFMQELEHKNKLQQESTFMKKNVYFKKRKKHLKIASLLLSFLLLTTIAIFLTRPQPSTAGKIELNIMEQEVENGFVEDSLGVTDSQAIEEIIEDEKHIDAMKDKYKNLVVPTYIPEGYKFETLSVKKHSNNDIKAIYVYQNTNNDKLNISQRLLCDNRGSVFANEAKEFEEVEKGKIFYQKDEKNQFNLLLYIIDNKNQIWISGSVSREELQKIQSGIKI